MTTRTRGEKQAKGLRSGWAQAGGSQWHSPTVIPYYATRNEGPYAQTTYLITVWLCYSVLPNCSIKTSPHDRVLLWLLPCHRPNGLIWRGKDEPRVFRSPIPAREARLCLSYSPWRRTHWTQQHGKPMQSLSSHIRKGLSPQSLLVPVLWWPAFCHLKGTFRRERSH